MVQAAAVSSRWDALDWVLAQNARDVLEHRYDLLAEVVSWFKSLSMFRETERDLLILRDPTAENLKDHRTVIAILIAEGERLLSKLSGAEQLKENPSGITEADLHAAVEHLYDTQAVWHAEMASARKVEILNGIAHGQKS